MIILATITLLASLWCLREVVVGLLARGRSKRLRHVRRREMTQRHFAEARNELMKLAVAGKIDVNSATFKRLYFLNTAIMRRPESYQEIGAALRSAILNSAEGKGTDALRRESEGWSDEVKVAIAKTERALSNLMVIYSRLWRLMYRFRHQVLPSLHFLARAIDWLIERAEEYERRDPFVSDVLDSQMKMRDLAARA